jgi:hypothetical protein
VLVAHACNPRYSEAEIRRIMFKANPRQVIRETDPISKKTITKRAGGEARGISPELKPHCCQKKKKKKSNHHCFTFFFLSYRFCSIWF